MLIVWYPEALRATGKGGIPVLVQLIFWPAAQAGVDVGPIVVVFVGVGDGVAVPPGVGVLVEVSVNVLLGVFVGISVVV